MNGQIEASIILFLKHNMPYIPKDKRKEVDSIVNELVKKFDTSNLNVGLLNYTISSLVWKLFKDNQKYRAINDIVGVLECVKLEYYRKMAVPYEILKEKENGDI